MLRDFRFKTDAFALHHVVGKLQNIFLTLGAIISSVKINNFFPNFNPLCNYDTHWHDVSGQKSPLSNVHVDKTKMCILSSEINDFDGFFNHLNFTKVRGGNKLDDKVSGKPEFRYCVLYIYLYIKKTSPCPCEWKHTPRIYCKNKKVHAGERIHSEKPEGEKETLHMYITTGKLVDLLVRIKNFSSRQYFFHKFF